MAEPPLRIAAFTPNTRPKRFLCLAMKSEAQIAVRSLESYGTSAVPYDPYSIRERLQNLQARGFFVVTDSDHEHWDEFPHISMMERLRSRWVNRDYALDQLVEYSNNGQLRLPPELMGSIPTPEMDYRRETQDPYSPYQFRNYRGELHAMLLAILGLIHPPMISENWIDQYFGVDPAETIQKDYRTAAHKTFQRITVQLDKEKNDELNEKYWNRDSF